MRAPSVSGIFFKTVVTGILISALLSSGCARFIFYPDRHVYSTPRQLGLNYFDVFLKTPDDVQIHGWFLKAKEPAKGTVFVLHGNAQNVSSHVRTVTWLPPTGYNVFILDYRGYGYSQGTPSIAKALVDIDTALTWLNNTPKVRNKPVFLLGQSLGAALGVCYIGSNPVAKTRISGVIIDAGFSSYRTLAKHKLAENWLTLFFKGFFPMFLTQKYDPKDFVKNLHPLPLLVMHSREDRIIPFEEGKQLYEMASEPKVFTETKGGHIETFSYEEYRRGVLKFMGEAEE